MSAPATTELGTVLPFRRRVPGRLQADAEAARASLESGAIGRVNIAYWAARYPGWAEIAGVLGITGEDAPDPATAARWAEMDATFPAVLAALQEGLAIRGSRRPRPRHLQLVAGGEQ
jgi:hypothetical protein